jgi:hypothetical protein
MSASWELQKGIYAVLNAGLSDPVYSLGDVPQDVTGKYVVIGEDTLLPHDADQQTGFDGTIIVHSWDRDAENRGLKDVKEMAGSIYSLLNRGNITVTGYTVLDSVFEFERSMLENDGLTAHNVQRYRIILTKQ